MYVYIYIYIHTYRCICICIYVSMYLCIYIYIYTCVYMYTCIHVYNICVYIYIYICVCVCVAKTLEPVLQKRPRSWKVQRCRYGQFSSLQLYVCGIPYSTKRHFSDLQNKTKHVPPTTVSSHHFSSQDTWQIRSLYLGFIISIPGCDNVIELIPIRILLCVSIPSRDPMVNIRKTTVHWFRHPSSHHFSSQDFNLRVSTPRAIAYLHFSTPMGSSESLSLSLYIYIYT